MMAQRVMVRVVAWSYLTCMGLAACNEQPDMVPGDRDGGAGAPDTGGATLDARIEPMPEPTVCSATSPCFYVTESGAGAEDGTSWSNAYAGLPSEGVHRYFPVEIARLERGATYFVADGRYPGYSLDDQGGGEDVVTIAKATAADHGTTDGWTDAMGDGEAVFESSEAVIVFEPSAKHYRFAGRVGSGKSPGAYGFRFFSTAERSGGNALVEIDGSGLYDDVGDVFDITFEHVDFDWDNGTPAGPCTSASAINIGGARPNGDWTVSDSYIHHAAGGAVYLRNGARYAFRDTYFYLMGDEVGGDCPEYGYHGHWETFWVTIDDAFELTRCTFENAYGDGQTGWVMMGATNVLIQDSLFFCSARDACAVGGNGVIGAWTASTNTNVLITHNTFRDFFDGAHFLFENGTNIVIRDNTYVNAPGLADTE